jgi:secreted Zn-dependent insulinase-like peptidase
LNSLFQSTNLYFFEALLVEWIKDNLYDALQISYAFSFQATKNGLEFSISGYNDKIVELSEELLISFRNLKMTQIGFDRVKSKFITDLEEEKMQQPYSLAFIFAKVIYQENGHTFDEILEAATTLSLDNVTDFHDHLFDKVYTKSLVHGNMAVEQAANLKDMIDKHLDFGTLEDPATVRPKMHILDGPYAYTHHAFNKDEQDSAILNSYQISYLKKDDPNDIKDFL